MHPCPQSEDGTGNDERIGLPQFLVNPSKQLLSFASSACFAKHKEVGYCPIKKWRRPWDFLNTSHGTAVVFP